MITGSITLQAAVDVETTRLEVTPTAIEVSPYNVQKEPLRFALYHIAGVDKKLVSGYIVVEVKSMDKVLGTVRLGTLSQGSYTIPKNQYATATAIRVIAYSDSSMGNVIDQQSVSVFCPKDAVPVYRGKTWGVGDSFRNGDYLETVINRQTNIYMWCSRVEGNTSKAPWDVTLSAEERGNWEHITEWTLFATKLLMAKGGLIGSAAFFDEYMMSQQGTAHTAGATYRNFDASMKDFTPNILINFLTGYAHFAKKNIIMDANGNITITGNIKAGTIGSFRIDKGIIGRGQADCGEAFIDLCNSDSSGFIRLNYPYGGGLVSLRDDNTRSCVMELNRFGKEGEALYILANMGALAIDSYGPSRFNTRMTETTMVGGFSVNVKEVTADTKLDGSEGMLVIKQPCTIYMPPVAKYKGKVYFVKALQNVTIRRAPSDTGSIFTWCGNRDLVDQLPINTPDSFMIVSDGERWIHFSCK